eukprot:GFYU01004055.1.p1 GENE.GFYU01004055.1~~GFYU01004055.1.p1  ORF type:complete len:175 (+),score=48.77 GFYU01004055.1:49-525(+)
MVHTLEGSLIGTGHKFGIVVSRFNKIITEKLLDGALEGLRRHGVNTETDVTIAWVPGAYEIPLTAKTMANTGKFASIICLGCVIRGATAHFDYVAGGSQSGIANTSLSTDVPCIFGVLTTENMDQALDRSGGKTGNKGEEAAVCAIEMANVLRDIKSL